MTKYDRNISLNCPSCGGATFEHDKNDRSIPVKCLSCDSEWMYDDLLEANGEKIDVEVQIIKDEVVKDMKKMIKRAFKGLK